MDKRAILQNKKRIIVKVGTALLSGEAGGLNLERMEQMARALARIQSAGREVILVSSGAVGAGQAKMSSAPIHDSLPDRQVMAAIGQAALMRLYDTFFNEYDITVGQVLLTRDGLENSQRRANARNTIQRMLELGVVPVINENDTVSTAEIEFGDNDLLSAMVADLVRADLLIILTQTRGLFTADPSTHPDAMPLGLVTDIETDLKGVNLEGISSQGSGGMQTKILAASRCMEKNIDTVIAGGKDPEILHDILAGSFEGTLFLSEASQGAASKNK